MYLGENYYAQYQNDIYLNKFTNKLLKCSSHKKFFQSIESTHLV